MTESAAPVRNAHRADLECGSSSGRSARVAVWVTGALLLAVVSAYTLLAWRGFEFTDEAFYFLHFLYWRDFVAGTSFFGAFFEWPFRLLGQSPAAIRVLTLVLLVLSAGLLARVVIARLCDGVGGQPGPWGPAFAVASAAASTMYFSHLSTVRAPSYNLLALCSAMWGTALLLRITSRRRETRSERLDMFLYGAALAICGLGKPTSGLFLAAAHALFLPTVGWTWVRQRLGELVVWAAFGVLAVVGCLHVAHPTWWRTVIDGASIVSSTDGRDLVTLAKAIRWDLQRLLEAQGYWGAIAVMAIVGSLPLIQRRAPAVASAVAALAAIAALLSGVMFERAWWWPNMVAASLVVLALGARAGSGQARPDARQLGIIVLLLLMPLGLSYGTNMSVLEHSQINGVLSIMGLLSAVYVMRNRLPSWAVALCFIAAAAPGLWLQAMAAFDVSHTYRQQAALASQSRSIEFGAAGSRLFVDEVTAQTVVKVRAMAAGVGWKPGDRVLDLTGDGPGLVYVLGGRPTTMAWILGGYPGSNVAADRLLSLSDPRILRDAWILSSSSNPRRIEGWEALVAKRLGPHSHELAGEVVIQSPYRWGTTSPGQVNVQLWRPRRGEPAAVGALSPRIAYHMAKSR